MLPRWQIVGEGTLSLLLLLLLNCVLLVSAINQICAFDNLCMAHKELGCRLPFECLLCSVLGAASWLVLQTRLSQSLSSLCNKFGAVWLSFLPSVYRIRIIPYLPQHQPESNTHRPIPARDGCVVVTIHVALKCGSTTTSNVFCRNIDNSGNGEGKPSQPESNTHQPIPAQAGCVVVAIARKCGSTTTSNVFCRNIDNSGNGEGKPFQLQKLEDRSFWTNEEVNNEELKVGCLLEYRGRTCCQNLLGRLCELGNRDGGQFIFVRNIGKKPQVSFHYYTNGTVVNRFLRNLRCPSVLADLDPLLLIWTPLQNFLFYNLFSIMKLFSFVGGCVCVSKLHTITCPFL